MKKNLVFVLLFLFHLVGAQNPTDALDIYVQDAPREAERSIETLTQYFNKKAHSDTEKARAAYVWVCENIEYADTVISNNWLGTPENSIQQQATNVFRKRAGVCEGFSNLFIALCEEQGLRAHKVTGIVKKEDGEIPEVGHAWAAYEADGDWFLCDPTWDSGYRQNGFGWGSQGFSDDFFGMQPTDFIEHHFPDDPIWQLTENPIPERFFRAFDHEQIVEKMTDRSENSFFFQDSIDLFLGLDTMEQVNSQAVRILKYSPENDFALARVGISFLQSALDASYQLDTLTNAAISSSNIHLDTTSILAQFDIIDLTTDKAFFYLDKIEKTSLLELVAELPSPSLTHSNMQFQRGLVALWNVEACLDAIGENRAGSSILLKKMKYQLYKMNLFFDKGLSIVLQNRADLADFEAKIAVFRAAGDEAYALGAINTACLFQSDNPMEVERDLTYLDQAELHLKLMKNRLESMPNLYMNFYGGGTSIIKYPQRMTTVHTCRGDLKYHKVSPQVDAIFSRKKRATASASKKLLDRLDESLFSYDKAEIFIKKMDGDNKALRQKFIYQGRARVYAATADVHSAVVNYEIEQADGQVRKIMKRKEIVLAACRKGIDALSEAEKYYKKVDGPQTEMILGDIKNQKNQMRTLMGQL